jgi:alpha-aminoadipate carrier protein LysW
MEKRMVECPICNVGIQFGSDAVVGELMSCPECGTELEITGLNPPAVAEAPQEEEDWGE